jgi:hypothetical protein
MANAHSGKKKKNLMVTNLIKIKSVVAWKTIRKLLHSWNHILRSREPA